ncbi:MAG: T9SS type A sorting domain-containing protein [Saprospiraceae bacterium]|nr:T9SS type A sorting domain-containing protein [Saprospiraceae bacterium]MCF8248983.1 T9SS type A sorting domain-containing protein [Saprospiraceae bacterium]MCF8279194.1 T9SS type A sorting domain-containing protein [Bacteroidales bacterium]MCF8310877.1 T9SS type A sorting domain-containing protein [Saprospiraceae bacterium]MCF8439535.1 T9SS type A sorting domain-containing protein [Saprospiraceae bacterium]
MKRIYLPFALFFFLTTSLFCQWEPKAVGTLPVDYYVSDISIVSEQVIWAVAIDYSQANPPVPPTHITKLLKSTDGGDTWEVKDIEEIMGRVSFDIHAFDENTVIITTQNLQSAAGRGLWRTTDGGENWNEEHPGSDGGYWVHFFNAIEGICINRQSMARTTDGGVTWNSIPPANIPAFQSGENTGMNTAATSLEAFGDILWFGTTTGRVFRSLDRGQNWDVFPSGFGNNAPIFSTAFVDEKNGIALYEASNEPDHEHLLIRTSDGGESWSSLDYDYDFEEVTAIPCSRVFVGVNWEDSITAISTDLGETWTLLDDETSPWAPVFKSPKLGWMANGSEAGANPALYKWVGDALYGRTFVNQNANGNNDGTSWADAFTDLQDALAAVEEGGEIWVAEGTYLPGGNPNATFLIDKNIQLYGGFAGTECNLSERDVELYPTVLSGDLNGNDVLDDFVTGRGDNVMTVVTVGDNLTEAAVIDGFTISNGQADGTISNQELRGGGLYTRGSVIVQHCLFTQNFAGVTGGGAYFYSPSSSDGVSVEVSLCRFEKNRTDRAGGGMMAHAWGQNSTFTLEDCEFSENEAQWNGGGMHAYTEENSGNANILVKGCTFFQNSTNEFSGGGISMYSDGPNTTFTITGCGFNENETPSSGSGLRSFLAGDNSNFVLRNSTFTENEAAQYGTATIWGFDPEGGGNVDISNCLFENNTATYSAGLSWGSVDAGGYFNWNLTNTDFIGNHATAFGGAMDFYGESPSEMTIEGCNFIGNSAGLEGGAILAATNHPEFVGRMSNCVFENNSSPAGAAIIANNFTEVPGMTQDADITFENCLMTGNTGDAGTFNLYNIGTVKLLNCTIALNQDVGIVQNENSALALQNTILYNPGGFIDYIGSTANTIVTSLGGNLIGDLSLDGLLDTSDQQDLDPLFAAPDDFHLSMSSSCINKGNNEGVTALFDLDWEDRIQHDIVDIGAYESPFVTSTREVITGEIGLSPNPATDFLFVDFPENIAQPVEVSLFNATGKLMSRQVATTGQAIDLQGLAPGMYWVKAVVGERVYTGKFSKF